MPSNTPNLNLFKKDPATDGEQLFDIKAMMNDNWDKIDTASVAWDETIENQQTDITALEKRLNEKTTQPITLRTGLSSISSIRDTPVNVLNLTGRMLLNLLGRAGNFDSLAGWSFTGGSGTVSTNQPAYGSNALLFTLSATSGQVARTIPTVPGSRYLIAVDIRIGTALSANLSIGGGPIGNVVNATSMYQMSYVLFTATAATTQIAVGVIGTANQTAYVDGFRVYELSAANYTEAGNMNASAIAAKYPYTEGLAGVRNPYAIRWTDNNKTDIGAMLAIQAEFFADPVTGANADTLSRGADGQYYRTANYRKIQLTGSLNWRYGDVAGVGFKQLAVNGLVAGAVAGSGIAIKYDGKILPQGTTGSVADVQAVSSSGDFFISIPVSDSGWGDNYTPTVAEIQAYFYGYKLYNAEVYTPATAQAATGATYNGTGSKYWVNLVGTPVVSNLPTTQAPNYTPYELLYRLAAPVTEPVVSEGQLSLAEGANVVEVGTGLIVREPTKPGLNASGTFYTINSFAASNPLQYKAQRFIGFYRNGLFLPGTIDNRNTTATYGSTLDIPLSSYQPDKTYTVSYVVLDNYPTATFTGTYPESERAALAEVVQGLRQAISRVSVVENRKVEKEPAVNRLYPIKLNSWVEYDSSRRPLSFYKDDSGVVHISGFIKGGLTNFGSLVFALPAGYRPSGNQEFNATSSDASSTKPCTIFVGTSGNVAIGFGVANTWLLIDIKFQTN